MQCFLRAYLADESGSAAAEYALILAVIGTSLGASAVTLGQSFVGAFNHVAQCVDNAGSC
ncbi:MAG TPA: Flp family type IVb pilin [Rhizomicrobium sp.]|nr:Flp family type IVb pilin [Rhizomicrobium sp.]